MRELKFRGWDGKLFYEPIICGEFHYADARAFEDGRASDSSLMQYVGLKDKNGIEIYEGDMLEYNGIFQLVQFQIHTRTSSSGHGERSATTFAGYSFDDYYGLPSQAKIVGNIYENPDLIAKNCKIF